MGSVVLYKNCTMGLKGSGLTQLINARISISQYIMVNTISKTLATAIKRLESTNMISLESRILPH